MKVLFAASEAIPFIKSGGLGDVVGTLPKYLKGKELDVRVILPKYNDIPYTYKETMTKKKQFNLWVGWRNQYCGIEECEMNGIHFYFVDNEYYFKRPGMYGYYDEAERFVYFCRSVLESLYHIDFKPDIIHCHDWQTALIPVLLEEQYRESQIHHNIKTLFTIHNLKYQGIFSPDILEELVGLSRDYARNNAFEFHGDINLLKAALYYSDVVTTVSPTYAKEIQHEFYGERLDGVLREIGYKLKGILNGIDYDIFHPKTDKHLYKNYYLCLKDKEVNKTRLQEKIGLPKNKKIPIIAIISRLVKQKGMDLVKYIGEEMLQMDVQFLVLGIGDQDYEQFFTYLEQKYPHKMKAFMQFDMDLAQKIYAASDIFLMPSLFEPCGLCQLICLKYGTIPIVRATGGLKDTIKPYHQGSEQGTGFVFDNYNAHELLYSIQRAVALYYDDKEGWHKVMHRGMAMDYSWNMSAKEYRKIFEFLCHKSGKDVR